MAFRFYVPPEDQLPIELPRRLILADFEGGLWACHAKRLDDQMIVVVDTPDSGYLTLPWRSAGGGEQMLTTATLVQRDRPYRLTLELARGTLHRLMSEVANWELHDGEPPSNVTSLCHSAKLAFTNAVTSQHNGQAIPLCDRALDLAVRGLSDFASFVTTSMLAQRDVLTDEPRPLRGCALGTLSDAPAKPNLFRQHFDTAIVRAPWRSVEREPSTYEWQIIESQLQWCLKHKLRTIVGPLAHLNPQQVPDWLYLYEEDRDAVVNHALAFVERAVHRCLGRVNLWYASSGLNAARSFGLGEESRLKLAADTIGIIRGIDRQTPIMIGFEQPWGEYLARSEEDLSPLGFADVLIRSNLGIAAIALELNFDVWPDGTVRRDAFDFLKNIDRWAQFQLPLIVVISTPSTPSSADAPEEYRSTRPDASPQTQAELLHEILPLLRLHRSVQGIVWNQWSDASDCQIPGTGFIDVAGRAKPALEAWGKEGRVKSEG